MMDEKVVPLFPTPKFDTSAHPLMFLTIQDSKRYAVDPDVVIAMSDSPEKGRKLHSSVFLTSGDSIEVKEDLEDVVQEYLRALVSKQKLIGMLDAED